MHQLWLTRDTVGLLNKNFYQARCSLVFTLKEMKMKQLAHEPYLLFCQLDDIGGGPIGIHPTRRYLPQTRPCEQPSCDVQGPESLPLREPLT